jgi:hypothetical protein
MHSGETESASQSGHLLLLLKLVARVQSDC